jgi:cobalt/nickel transport system permease protein
MHMADALVSTAVGATMWCATGGTLSASIRKIRLDFDEKKVPMMGIMGAFVFASQMINFTIPGTGSSGHIGGAMLLAGILGPAPAFLTLAVVLLIQALFFADGGLLAYGCNVFNMGFYACFIAYPLIFKPILKRGITKKRLTIASIAATVIGLQLGAFSVVMETLLSGITELPFEAFLIVMQPIHLAIGIVEGIITAGVLNYVYSIRADIIEDTLGNSREVNEIHKNTHQWKKVILIFAVFSVIIGAVFSQFASSKPDGLEWSIAKTTNQEEIKTDSQVNEKLDKIQKKVALLPDYTLPNQDNERIGTSISGVIGGIAVCAFSAVLGVIITRHRKRENSK